MISKRPSIYIYTNHADAAVLKDVCAGIEEEGAFYEIFEHGFLGAEELAYSAAQESMLGSGLGISGKKVILQMRGLPQWRHVESYEVATPEVARKIGSNSARAIKKEFLI